MRVRLRLKQILDEHNDTGRGVIKKICDHTSLERHKVAAMLNDRVQYLSLDALSAICSYLMEHHGLSAAQLPGRLFALEREDFWSLVARRRSLEICFGVRSDVPHSTVSWVTTVDSDLYGVLLHELYGAGSLQIHEQPESLRQVHVSAFQTDLNPAHAEAEAAAARDEALSVHNRFHSIRGDRGLLCLGSVKSNVAIEAVVAGVFGTRPYVSEDNVAAPTDRKVPFFFRYRDDDVQPLSCHGGIQLSHSDSADVPGIYFEGKKGRWQCCPCNEEEDAAFVFYSYRPPDGVLEAVLGGFSSRATFALARALADRDLAQQLWPPSFDQQHRQVGAFVIRLRFRKSGSQRRTEADVLSTREKAAEMEVFPVPQEAFERRLR
ncbi:MAG: helix-turn-helix domain-containing protein [Planctomycetaceae bacterium]